MADQMTTHSSNSADRRPAVSVIVAVYNIEQYVTRAITSLTTQTLRDLEIIAVDDGSTDQSGRLLDELAKTDERIRVIHRENGGLSAARNSGLAIARGKYIGFLDGDDWAESSMYERMYTACQQQNAQVAIVRYQEEDEQKPEKPDEISLKEETCPDMTKDLPNSADRRDDAQRIMRVLPFPQALEYYFSDGEEVCIMNSVWSKLFLKDLVADTRFPEGHNSEDILFTTRMLRDADRCVYLDLPLYHYVVNRSGSIMNRNLGERRLNDELPFIRQQVQLLKEKGLSELADLAAWRSCRQLLYYDLEFRAAKELREYALRLEKELRSKEARKQIAEVYQNPFVPTGDRWRMRLFQLSPSCYAAVVRGYEKWILPLRSGQ